MIVDRNDFLGMSRGLFPPSGLQSNATVAGRSCDIRSMWPIIYTLLLMMVVLRPVLFILLRISLLVILSCQCTPRIFLRHLFWKVSSCLLDFIVLIQVSAAYAAVEMAIALNSLSFVLTYTFLVLIFSNFLNTPAPLSAPNRISNSASPLDFWMLPRYEKLSTSPIISSLSSNKSVSVLQAFCTLVLSTLTLGSRFFCNRYQIPCHDLHFRAGSSAKSRSASIPRQSTFIT